MSTQEDRDKERDEAIVEVLNYLLNPHEAEEIACPAIDFADGTTAPAGQTAIFPKRPPFLDR